MAAFQSALARLVMDPAFRNQVRAEGPRAAGGTLTPVERRRLAAAAADPGMDAVRIVHKGFRLAKLLSMLPATCAVLGEEGMAREVPAFWLLRPSRGRHYAEEAEAFCAYLEMRLRAGLTVPGLAAVIVVERARLRQRERARTTVRD